MPHVSGRIVSPAPPIRALRTTRATGRFWAVRNGKNGPQPGDHSRPLRTAALPVSPPAESSTAQVTTMKKESAQDRTQRAEPGHDRRA